MPDISNTTDAPSAEVLVISSSLNPNSRSRILAREAHQRLQKLGVETQLIDLQDYPLPLCDGDTAYDDPLLPELKELIGNATTVLLAMPVYNFDVSASVKNLLELTGNAWREKITGFLMVAGGHSSYMSSMGFANSLMLDFRCLVIPRFVYAVLDHFEEGRIIEPEIRERIQGLVEQAATLTRALGRNAREEAAG